MFIVMVKAIVEGTPISIDAVASASTYDEAEQLVMDFTNVYYGPGVYESKISGTLGVLLLFSGAGENPIGRIEM